MIETMVPNSSLDLLIPNTIIGLYRNRHHFILSFHLVFSDLFFALLGFSSRGSSSFFSFSNTSFQIPS